MSIQVTFTVDGAETALADVDDDYLAEMLAHTGEQVMQETQYKLGGLTCAEHGQAPAVVVSAAYDSASDQKELNYHVDACCPTLLLRAVAALNHCKSCRPGQEVMSGAAETGNGFAVGFTAPGRR
jgi:hypothetical protein